MIDQTYVRLTEQTGGYTVAGHVHRLESGLLHHACAVSIVNTGGNNHAAFGQPLAQLLSYREICRHV